MTSRGRQGLAGENIKSRKKQLTFALEITVFEPVIYSFHQMVKATDDL
jgi:hypothetical protein